MMAIRYLDYETVVEINAEHCGDGAGVRDADRIRAALGRIESSFMGEDLHPTVVDKAAALLHGLSSTQGFSDGNKRTAWLAAKLFLALNGHYLRPMEDVQVEAFVLSIATKAFESDDLPRRGVEKAAEWYQTAKLRASDRYAFGFFSTSVEVEATPGAFSATDAMISMMHAERAMPWRLQLYFVANFIWRSFDIGSEQTVTLALRDATAAPIEIHGVRDAEGQIARKYTPYGTLHPQHGDLGASPSLVVVPFILVARGDGTAWIDILLNGELVASLPFTVGAI